MSTSAAVRTPTITGEVGSDRVLVLTIDDPTQSTNTMNTAFGQSLEQTVDWLEANRDAYDGVIIPSAKDSFFSGGDLELLRDAEGWRITQLSDTRRTENCPDPLGGR